jgi:outer membrane protein assembly factor BamB
MVSIGLAFVVATLTSGSVGAAPAPHSVSAGWPQFQGSAAHRGYNPNERAIGTDNVSGLALSWVGEVPGSLNWASPVVARGQLFITGGDSGLVVFPAAGCGSSTCQPSWLGATGPQSIATPAVANGLVYVPSQTSFDSNHGRLNVFDADGCGAPLCRPLWKGIGGHSSFLVSSPAVIGGRAFVASYDGRLYVFDAHGCGARQCPPMWTGQTGAPIDSSPAVAGGMIYVGATDGKLYAFPAGGCGASRCAPSWRGPTGGSIDIGSPTVAGGMVLVGNGRFLNVFDGGGCGAVVCRPLWRGRAELFDNTPAVLNGTVYVDAQPVLQGGRSIGVVEAFDLHGCGAPTCAPRWFGINFSSGPESSPVVANGVVYVGKGPATFLDSGIFAYDARGCGARICLPIGFAQTSQAQQFYLSSTPAVANGHVYMGSTETDSNQAGLYVFALPSS